MKVAFTSMAGLVLLAACGFDAKDPEPVVFAGKYEYVNPLKTLSEINEFWEDSVATTVTITAGSCTTVQFKRTFTYTGDSLCFSKGIAMTRDTCGQEFQETQIPPVCRKTRHVDVNGFELYRPPIPDVDSGAWFYYGRIE